MRPTTERLCLAILIGAVVAFHALTLGGQSLFVDEVAELQHARGSLAEVAFRADSMPPIFNLMVAAWTRTVGEGTSARVISVGLSLATTLLVWRIGRRLGHAGDVDPSASGVASAVVFSALPLQLYYAQLIRGYALMTFAAALTILAFVRAIDRDRPRDWAVFAAAGALGMWCHYYFAITLIVLLGALMWRRGAMIGRVPLLAGVAIVIACLPLLPFLLQDFGYQRDLRDPRPLSAAAIGYTGFTFYSGYTLGPSKAELHQITAANAARQAAPWAAALVVALAPMAWRGGVGLRRGKRLGAMLGLTIGPIIMVGLLGVASGITYNPRFVAWCLVPIALWLGIGVAEGLRHAGKTRLLTLAGCSLLGTIAAIAITQRHTVDRYRTEDLTSTAEWIADNVSPEATVFVVSDYLAPQLAFLAEIAEVSLPAVVALPRPGDFDQVVSNEGGAEEAVSNLRRAAGERPFWLVECRTFHTDPEGRLHAAIERSARLEPAVEFAGVKVYRGRLASE